MWSICSLETILSASEDLAVLVAKPAIENVRDEKLEVKEKSRKSIKRV